MLTEKQEEFYNLILNSYSELNEIPSIGYLKRKSSYKSYNTIYKYIFILKKKGYIDFDDDKKKITYLKKTIINSSLIEIPILNDFRFLSVPKKSHDNKEYLAYIIHNNRLINYHIINKDTLIFEKSTKNLNNKIVLAFIDNEYKVLKYKKEDEYIHLLNSKENYFITNNQNIIGKLVTLIRNTKD